MIIIAIILLVLVGIVAFLNMDMATLNLYFTSLELPLWLLFVGFLLIGMLIAALFAMSKGARNRQVIKNKNEELKNAETSRDDAVNRVKKESEAQLELQKKEAEIQSLNTRLAGLENNQTAQQNETATNTQQADPISDTSTAKEIHVEEYHIDDTTTPKK
ncbi:MAG: hypothetical protein PWR19_1945 [Carnobacterium sp.]|nr:lipopolysaccharide assembly protein LapA domain-containing protein [Carnobacterium sp.]MDN5372899.1 hypothetical protein [Carnobacterium sp.]